MELDAPVRISDQSYIVDIHVEGNIVVEYPSRETGTHTTPESTEPLQEFMQRLAATYEEYSRRWFHNQVTTIAFMKRLSHLWQFDSHQPYAGALPEGGQSILVRQTWCPEKLHILPRAIQLQWKLLSASYEVEKPSGFFQPAPLEEFSVENFPEEGAVNTGMDLHLSSVREKAIRKVREARLRAAAARWHANELVARYYERYGTTELLDGDSVLSSEDETTAPPENKK